MLKLKLQYFGHLMQRVDSLEKTLMLGGIGAGGEGDDRGWDGWMASPTRWTWAWVDSRSWCWTGRPDVLQVMGSQGVRHNWATKLNWTEPHEESSVTGPSTFLFQKMCDWKNKKVTTGQKSNQITNLCTFSSRICSAVLGKSPHFLYMSFSYCI